LTLRRRTLQLMAAGHTVTLSLLLHSLPLPFFLLWLLDGLLMVYVTVMYRLAGRPALMGVATECLFTARSATGVIVMLEGLFVEEAQRIGWPPVALKLAAFLCLTLCPVGVFVASLDVADKIVKRFQLKP